MIKTDKKLPIGVDRFEALIRQNYYYLDKTGFIGQLINWHGEVNIFTRPRRFGKTLNMSMLKAFFEIGTDKSLFDGLKISKEREICDAYQGQYPVLFLSLKGIDGETFDDAMKAMAELLSAECQRISSSLDTEKISEFDRERLDTLIKMDADVSGMEFAPAYLMRILHTYYGKQVIFLIDEYDVPLDKANSRGYYDRMLDFLRGFLGSAFKTNPDLYFAVATGCLRISKKENIFTGLNNLKVDTISDERYDEYFGFTDEDMQKILADYGLSDAYGVLKEWYDGYHFGSADVYCPWGVVNHCDKLLQSPDAEPELYWYNTSSNEIIRRFIENADVAVRNDIEWLIAGEALEKNLVLNLTYQELDKKELLWSVKYQTGYLTLDRSSKSRQRGIANFIIPNREIKEIFVEKIREWFAEKVVPGHQVGLYDEIWNCKVEELQHRIRDILYDTISCHDYHENYYHALMVGLLLNGEYDVRSNYEMGGGRSDIAIVDQRRSRVVIIETKRSKSYDYLEKDCEEALKQIQSREYAWPFQRKEYQVIAYGISFVGKSAVLG